MELSIDSLQQSGAFTGAPVEKEIRWKIGGDEYNATVFVRRLGYASAVESVRAMQSKQDGIAARIAASICDSKGSRIFTPADITGEADVERGPLNHDLTMELLRVIGEVNSLGKTKRSPQKTNSGTSLSSTESEDEPSQKPSET